MEKYAIYSYKLKEKPIRNFNFPTDGTPHIETMALEKRFEMLFGKKRGSSVEIQIIKKNRDVDYCPCKVVAHESESTI